MTRKVLFSDYQQFLSAIDDLVINAISLFLNEIKRVDDCTVVKTKTNSECITYIIDFLLRFSELQAKGILSINDWQLVLSYFTAEGIKETTDELFSNMQIADCVAGFISDRIMFALDTLHGYVGADRVQLRKFLQEIISEKGE